MTITCPTPGQEGGRGPPGRPPAARNLLIFKGKSHTLRRKSGRFSPVSRWKNFSSRPRRAFEQLLKDLEINHLEGGERRAARRPPAGERRRGEPAAEINELMRQKQDRDRRIAQLKTRKGNELGD